MFSAGEDVLLPEVCVLRYTRGCKTSPPHAHSGSRALLADSTPEQIPVLENGHAQGSNQTLIQGPTAREPKGIQTLPLPGSLSSHLVLGLCDPLCK